MKHHVDIIDGIRDIFIEMSKVLYLMKISLITNKYKTLIKKWMKHTVVYDH